VNVILLKRALSPFLLSSGVYYNFSKFGVI
jgi:hypothetical protein